MLNPICLSIVVVDDGVGRFSAALSAGGPPTARVCFAVRAVLVANLQSPRVALALLISLIAAMVIFALVSADMIRQRRRTESHARTAFEDSEQEFHHMADNIQEVFWMIDADSKRATYVNPAYETVTGRSSRSLIEEPSSYEKVIHPDDRAHVLAKLEHAAQNGYFDERFRILRPDGEIRWVWARGFPRRNSHGKITRLGGTVLDITALKTAEDQVAANLARANSSWAEAEALRKATLALTEDLHMDSVLDALLCSLAELVPYTCARVLVPEGGPHWLALGEKSFLEPAKKSPRCPLTFVGDESPLFQRIWSVRVDPVCCYLRVSLLTQPMSECSLHLAHRLPVAEIQ
ncbi:MAG TPA: PAS domain-containing protein [Candidatus Acidoferrum sp.]|nr:PAS domain-containing protein [Candidatus Acidoferrum sp.]